LDEAESAGGQVYRSATKPEINAEARAAALPAGRSRDEREGDKLRAALFASKIDLLFGRRVWSVSDRFQVDAIGHSGPETITAPRIVAATGAYERVVPFPGWTIPGVIGLAAATTLLKSQKMLPGRRVMVAGCGPLLAAVAAKIVESGGEVAAVVDMASPLEWLSTLPYLAARPSVLAEGFTWALRVCLRRVPIFFRHAIRRAEGKEVIERVTFGPVDAKGRPRQGKEHVRETDCLAIGHGLVPGSDITRLLRAEHRFDRIRGGWVPMLDADGRTSIPGLYAAGDGAGIAGAIPAAISGRLAGLAAASDSGCVPNERGARMRAKLLRKRSKAMPFADAMAGMMQLRPSMLANLSKDTIVCRCEDVAFGEIESAVASGAIEVNQLKHFTRCGMGPCQGRMCGDVVAELLAIHVGSREAVGQWTQRPPLRPVPLAAVLGDFRYEDIPIPEAAPL
jgi:thioredoxin reductase